MDRNIEKNAFLFFSLFIIHTIVALLLVFDSSIFFLPGRVEIKQLNLILNFNIFFQIAKYWILALSATWLILLLVARKTKVFLDFEYKPSKDMKTERKYVGFINDRYYTFHQFMLLPVLIIFVIIYSRFDSYLQFGLAKGIIQSSASQQSLQQLMVQFTRWTKYFLFLAPLAFIGGFLHQLYILRKRKDWEDIFWWDWRINKLTYSIRILFVGIDYFMLAIILVHSVIFSFIIRTLGEKRILKYYLFDPKNSGGFSPLAEVSGLINFLFVFLLLLGILSSIHHRNLPSYRLTDKFVFLVIPIILISVLFLSPLYPVHKIMLESKFNLIEANKILIEKTNLQIESFVHSAVNDSAQSDIKMNLINQGVYLMERNRYLDSLPTWPFNTRIFSLVFVTILVPFSVALIDIFKPKLFKNK